MSNPVRQTGHEWIETNLWLLERFFSDCHMAVILPQGTILAASRDPDVVEREASRVAKLIQGEGSVYIFFAGNHVSLEVANQERIICAALWVDDGIPYANQPHNIGTGFVVGGWRHHNAISSVARLVDVHSCKRTQGFLTSKNRFLNRIEAVEVALAAHQIEERVPYLESYHLY